MKILAILILLNACNSGKQDSTTQDTIRAKVNETFEIKLATSMGTGYSWSPKDSAFLENISLDTMYVVNNPEGKDNGPDLQVFRFKALKKSNTTLHFIRSRSWKKNEPPDMEKKYTVFID